MISKSYLNYKLLTESTVHNRHHTWNDSEISTHGILPRYIQIQVQKELAQQRMKTTMASCISIEN